GVCGRGSPRASAPRARCRSRCTRVRDLPDEAVGLGIVGSGLLEVRADAAPERRRLADVDHLRLGITVEIGGGPVGGARQPLVEGHGSIVGAVWALERDGGYAGGALAWGAWGAPG